MSDRRETVEALQAKFDAVKLQAQLWKQEARTANATIAEIYRICTGGTGEPGNWNGAEPVRAALEGQQSPEPTKQEQIESVNAFFDAMRNGEEASMTLSLAGQSQSERAEPVGPCSQCEGEGRIDDPERCLRCGRRGCRQIECPACGGTGASPQSSIGAGEQKEKTRE